MNDCRAPYGAIMNCPDYKKKDEYKISTPVESKKVLDNLTKI